jgi:hypothetical protein
VTVELLKAPRTVPTPRSYTSARRLSRRALFAALGGGLTLVGACSSAKVGLQSDGSYSLDGGEQSMDCQRLSNSTWGRLQILKALPERIKTEQAAAAPTFVQAMGRMFGGSSQGLASLKEYDRERAHVRSLHRRMLEKGCAPIDVEREIAASDAAISEYRK